MAARTDRDVVDRYVAALKTLNLAALDDLLADDVVEVYPQSGERFSGARNVRAILENYPGLAGLPPPVLEEVIGSEDRWVQTPVFTLVKVAGGGEAYTITGRVAYPNGDEWYAVSVLRVSGGRIRNLTTFFAPPFPPADWRAPYRDAMPAAAVASE